MPSRAECSSVHVLREAGAPLVLWQKWQRLHRRGFLLTVEWPTGKCSAYSLKERVEIFNIQRNTMVNDRLIRLIEFVD